MRCLRAKPGTANRITRNAITTTHALQKLRESARFKTLAGKERRMCPRRCTICQRWFWGTRDRYLVGRQKEVGKLCRQHFFERYGKVLPYQFRFLNHREILGIENSFTAAGCTVYRVDPSSL